MGVSSLDRVMALLTTRMAEDGAVPATPVTADSSISDLGVDSIDLVYILSTFERSDDVAFTDQDFEWEGYRTVRDLAAMIDARSHG